MAISAFIIALPHINIFHIVLVKDSHVHEWILISVLHNQKIVIVFHNAIIIKTEENVKTYILKYVD